VAIETAGIPGTTRQLSWSMGTGKGATIITGDSRETTYLFQQSSVALQKKERGLVSEHVHKR